MTWVQTDPANEKVWWGTIYPKLLPVQLSGDPESPLLAGLTVTFVQPD